MHCILIWHPPGPASRAAARGYLARRLPELARELEAALFTQHGGAVASGTYRAAVCQGCCFISLAAGGHHAAACTMSRDFPTKIP